MWEFFYKEEYDMLVDENENFDWYIVFLDLQLEDNWNGLIGFIYNVLFEQYLKDYDVLEDCEYYMCGLSMMNVVVFKMLEDLGVECDNIFLDDFGG